MEIWCRRLMDDFDYLMIVLRCRRYDWGMKRLYLFFYSFPMLMANYLMSGPVAALEGGVVAEMKLCIRDWLISMRNPCMGWLVLIGKMFSLRLWCVVMRLWFSREALAIRNWFWYCWMDSETEFGGGILSDGGRDGRVGVGIVLGG